VRRALAVLVLGLAGCAYYNGLYNARRLDDEAHKAEGEGRTGEARSLWSRAAVKAESVAVRYPTSRWRDDAWLLWGQSLRRIDACSRAVGPLRLAGDSTTDSRIADAARITEAECRLFMREPDSAVAALGPVVAANGPRRGEALALRARAHLAAGRPAAALEDARASRLLEAAFSEATALARLGLGVPAGALLDQLADGPFVESAWTEVLAALARVDPDGASRITRRLAGRADLDAGTRARLFVADGERWLVAGRPAEAEPLFASAVAMARDSLDGRVAEAHLLMMGLGVGDDPGELETVLASVRRVTAPGGRPVQIAGRALNLLPEVIEAHQQGDEPARLFIAAETVRDSLGAPGLAAMLFLEVARGADDQVLAPKAILAALSLRDADADSLTAILHTRYAGSVYVLALQGEAGERYRVVEDSLREVFTAVRQRTNTEERPAREGEPRRNTRGSNE